MRKRLRTALALCYAFLGLTAHRSAHLNAKLFMGLSGTQLGGVAIVSLLAAALVAVVAMPKTPAEPTR